jgi:hypothetical protein
VPEPDQEHHQHSEEECEEDETDEGYAVENGDAQIERHPLTAVEIGEHAG